LTWPRGGGFAVIACATARDKSWVARESVAGTRQVVNVVASLAALFERKRERGGGEVKRRRWEKETQGVGGGEE